MSEINYWVVGATFGETDMYPEFIEENFWYLGWEQTDNANIRVNEYLEKASQITKGDRIAIKRLLGKGHADIKIMAIGVVRKVVKDIVFVNWIQKDLNRHVPMNGCVGSVYGPYKYGEEWTDLVFSI